MKFNRKIKPFGAEHNKLQASVMAVFNRVNVVRAQSKHSMEVDTSYGFVTAQESVWELWKKDDPEGVEKMWHFHEIVTPENGEAFLTELGVDIKELLSSGNILV